MNIIDYCKGGDEMTRKVRCMTLERSQSVD